jgi:hypothetical protein
MSGSLPNDNDPEDVLRQILDWSQNRPTRDLHKLQTLIENANGLDEPHHPAAPVPPPAALVPPPVAPAALASAQVQNKQPYIVSYYYSTTYHSTLTTFLSMFLLTMITACYIISIMI